MKTYFQAEQKVLNKMSCNPSIPSEAFATLVHKEFGIEDEYEVNEECKPKLKFLDVPLKIKKMDLGTEPEDWDLLNDGLGEQEVLE